jgi:DNA end-binding protein Ku
VPQPEKRGRREGGPVARGIWSGSITFGLVTVPVELYSAQRRGGVSFRMLAPDGTPLKRQYVCPEDGEPLEDDQIARGYEAEKGEFVVVSDEELDALAPRRSRDIELLRFVDRNAIDPGYFVRSYFLVPGGEQTKAYRLLAETMEASGRAGIATFVMRGKAYAVAIVAEKGVLRAETLRFGDELRTAEDVGLPAPGKVDRGKVNEMKKAMDKVAADRLDESVLVDPEPERLLSLARAKRSRGEDVVTLREAAEGGAPASVDVVDLMALLKQRLHEGKAEPARPTPARRGAADQRARQPRRASGGKRGGLSTRRGARQASGSKRRGVTKRPGAHHA